MAYPTVLAIDTPDSPNRPNSAPRGRSKPKHRALTLSIQEAIRLIPGPMMVAARTILCLERNGKPCGSGIASRTGCVRKMNFRLGTKLPVRPRRVL